MMEIDDIGFDKDGTEDRGSWMGNAILVVITLGFLAGLVPMAGIFAKPLYHSFAARNWQPAEAVITSLVLDQPDRRQYRIDARYRYNWQGAAHTGTAVFFDDMVGVRVGYYRDVYRALARHRTPTNPLTVWVDPDAPDRAVIYRLVRWDKTAANFGFFAIWALITACLTGACWAHLGPRVKQVLARRR